MDPMNPGARPRRGVIAVASLATAGALVGALAVALPSTPAAASGLATFASCGEVAAWGEASRARQAEQLIPTDGLVLQSTADDAGPAGGSSPTAAAGAGRGSEAGAAEEVAVPTAGAGGTNVVVAGVDELDLVDRLDGERALVVADDRLAIVDLAAAELVATVAVPAGAQVTHDADAAVAWVVGSGGVDGASGQVAVTRVSVGDRTLTVEAEWTTSGTLVDARRVGDRLHLVATEGFAATTGDGGGVAVPFEDGPVPCDQVLHPVGPSDPSATLLVTLPVTGALEPVAATEVVGAGQLVHVTPDAAYLATPLGEAGRSVTALHRFDLDGLTHTGSGRVDGALLDDFSISEHEGTLRVAVTHDGGGFGGPMPVPIDDVGDGVAISEQPVAPAPDAAPPVADQILNEVVVLDTQGDLDVVGRTERFGHPGERVHGVRFVGEVAYAVTFLQTDPFYVLDLSSPSAPVVTGEVELPGFSAYLHPISDSLVAGFGPDGSGAAAVKLFDVSDPTAPRVVDDLALGDGSPVIGDHHAFVDLGEGRFAVPATTYRGGFPESCPPAAQADARQAETRILDEVQELVAGKRPTGEAAVVLDEQVEALYAELDAVAAEGCLYPGSVPDSAVVVIDASGGELREVARHEVRVAAGATRVLPAEAGWAVLGAGELVLLDDTGAERARLGLD